MISALMDTRLVKNALRIENNDSISWGLRLKGIFPRDLGGGGIN